MSALLDDIITLAEDGKQPLPDILRKCLRLGHELKNQRLIDWANQELNGYESENDLPAYRIVAAAARGNFVGPLQMRHSRVLIPSVALEERHREFAERVCLMQSVSAYADILGGRGAESSRNVLTSDWHPNMVAYYQHKLMSNGFVCAEAWQEIPVNVLAEMLDTIRHRTLNMALQLKDELGTSYANLHHLQPIKAEKIQSIVINNVGNTNFAYGGNVDASGRTNIVAGDWQSLERALCNAGLDKQDVNSLSEATKADGGRSGNSVKEWVKEKASKVVAGGVKIGTTAGAEILAALIRQHYGIY